MTGYLNGGSNVTDGTVTNGLQDTYAALGIRAQVNVHTFSFLSNDIAQQMETLQRADIFWFAGVHAVPERLKQALSRSNDETGVNDLAAQVRRRVQYEHMPYVGVCGGAQMASSPETCGYGCGLDLMQGQEIYYASHEERNNVGSKFFFTEKCAFAVLLEATRCFAVAFPCTKDGGATGDIGTTSQCYIKEASANATAVYGLVFSELGGNTLKSGSRIDLYGASFPT